MAALALAACVPPEPQRDPPLAVVSIFPVGDLLERVAGDAVHVEVLLPPRASPATWEATPGQIRMLARASAYVTVGAGLDRWLDGFGRRPGLRVVRLTDGLALRAAHDHVAGADAAGDPHVWLSPRRVRDEVVPRLAELAAALAPASEDAVRRRARLLADSLTALDEELRALLEPLPRRAFVATHEAWAYFAEAYGLEPLGSLYERPGHEPSARGLAGLVAAARAAGVATVLAEPQLAPSAARALAAELGGSVRIVDPMGGAGVEGRDGYAALLRFNGRAFAAALGGP